MKVTYNWLKDFVDIRISPEKLAEKLTMAGLEAVSLEEAEGDFVFEIEVTSNRPDWLSVVGIAREVAAITGSRLKELQGSRQKGLQPTQPSALSPQPLSIKVEDKKDCPLYTAKIIKGVKVCPSPEWLKRRLSVIGCRSVNNIVDITNYVLFELGEPLHAFDLDKIFSLQPPASSPQPSIIVRRAKPNEAITTIDGIKRILNENILVIADSDKPLAIAGVMGGKDAEVAAGTTNILLEAAIFNPLTVRRARQDLGLQTDSAYRFERGVAQEAAAKASWRAAQLIQEICGGDCVLAKSLGAHKKRGKTILLAVSGVNKLLGANISPHMIKNILASLDFKTKTKAKDKLVVEPPAHRQDVMQEADLIEEVARIYGYGLIPASAPAVKPQISIEQGRDCVSWIKNILLGLGLNEAITYSLIDKGLSGAFNEEALNYALEVANPLSKEQEILRLSLIPGLSACVAYNLNQKQDYINIFEIASIYRQSCAQPEEELALGICLAGSRPYVFEKGIIKEEAGFLHLKGIIEVLFERLGIGGFDLNINAEGKIDIYAGQEKLGVMEKLGSRALDRLGIKNKEVFALEVSLKKIFSYAKTQKSFLPLPKYPGIARDISFILKEGLSLKEILSLLREAGGELLSDIRIIDYYQGKQIPQGHRSFTVSCLYRSLEKTLTEEEINPLHNRVCAVLTEKFGAKIRA